MRLNIVEVNDRAHQHSWLLRYSPATENVGSDITVVKDGHCDRPVGVESSMKYVYKLMGMQGSGVISRFVTDVEVDHI